MADEKDKEKDLSENLQDINVVINGDTTGLDKALEEVNKKMKDITGELAKVDNGLKLDPSSTVLLTQKQTILKDAVEATKDKLSSLKSVNDQIDESAKNGSISSEQYRAYQREVENTSNSLKQFGSQTEEINKSQSKLNTVMSKVGITTDDLKNGAVSAGSSAQKVLKDSVKAAEESNEADYNLNRTLKGTGDAVGLSAKELENLAEKEQMSTTFSKPMIEAGESTLLTFTNIGKDVFPQATQSLLDLAQKMGKDPKDAAQVLGKALNDPINSLDSLTSAGVIFSSSQKEAIKQMASTGNTAGAQKLILQDLNKQFGGEASDAAKTFDGSMKQTKNSLDDVKASIGNALLPVLQTMMKSFKDILQPVAQFISEHPKVTAGILSIVAGVGTFVKSMETIDRVKKAFGGVADIFKGFSAGKAVEEVGKVKKAFTEVSGVFKKISFTKLLGGIGKIKTVFGGVANTLKSFALKSVTSMLPVTLIIAGIALAAVLIITHWTQIKTFFTNLWNGVKKVFNVFWAWLKGFMSGWGGILLTLIAPCIGIPLMIATHWTKVKTFFANLWNEIKKIFNVFWTWLKGFMSGWGGVLLTLIAPFIGIPLLIIQHWSTIKTSFIKLGNNLKSIWNEVLGFFTGLPGRFASIAGRIGSAIKGGFDSAISFIKSLPSKMFDWGKDMIDSFIKGIKNMVHKVGDVVGSIGNTIKSFLHHSKPDEGPLADDDTWMPDFMQGLADGIQNNKHLVTNAVRSLASDVNVGMKLTSLSTQLGELNKYNGNAAMKTNNSDPFKKPVVIQLVTPDKRNVAEWLIDDIDLLQGNKTLLLARGQGQR